MTGLLVLALTARLAVTTLWPDHLTEDRDRYLALAAELAQGHGYVIPDTQTPTAFRPPLYPLALVPAAFLPNGLWVGTLQTVLGVATVWLAWVLASRLTVQSGTTNEDLAVPLLAGLFVATDPLLLRYGTYPMTETLATFLVTALLVVIAPESKATETGRRRRSILAGILFGLAALCRPAVWAFAGLMGLWSCLQWVVDRVRRHRQSAAPSGSDRSPTPPVREGLTWQLTLAIAAVVLLPWVVRNSVRLGHPIVMTTHGGYTLLLGNNPAFDREVVRQPWGTVWDGSHGEGQSVWAHNINLAMDAAGLTSEIARDRWMNARAQSNILSDPGAFGRACWLRMRRFWGVVPIEGAGEQPQWLRWSVGTYYLLLFAGGLAGLFVVCRERRRVWAAPLLMTVAFMSVHLLYWTNTRMRAPVTPVIAVLAAVGWSRIVFASRAE